MSEEKKALKSKRKPKLKLSDLKKLKKLTFDDLIGMIITLPGCQRPSDNEYIMFKVAKVISPYNGGHQVIVSENGNYYSATIPQLFEALEKYSNVESIVQEPKIIINGKFQGE